MDGPYRIAVIPAKGTSRRIPDKNIRPFHGKPMLAYAIEVAEASGMFDHICVSTENEAVVKVAKQYGAEICKRPFELAELHYPDCGTQEVARHAIEMYRNGGTQVDFACCIYPCTPLLTPADLILGYQALMRIPSPPFAYAVDLEGEDAGCFYWGSAAAFLDREPLENGVKITLPPERTCDINTEDDWQMAKLMYLSMQAKQEET